MGDAHDHDGRYDRDRMDFDEPCDFYDYIGLGAVKKPVVCRYCGEKELWWENIDNKWHLYNAGGDRHQCGDNRKPPIGEFDPVEPEEEEEEEEEYAENLEDVEVEWRFNTLSIGCPWANGRGCAVTNDRCGSDLCAIFHFTEQL